MNEEKSILSEKAAEQLIAAADGNAALLCIYYLRYGRKPLPELAKILRHSEEDLRLADATLRRLGLIEAPQMPLPDETLPQLSARDLKDVAVRDAAFQGVVAEAEKTMGRVLSDNDLRILFGLYNHLGLPADVIMLLLHHCVEEYELRSGAGRRPPMRFIEKEGWRWAGLEILNLDAAEAYVTRVAARRETAERAKEALGIRGRALTQSERKYVDRWLDLGFGPEALAIAYDRTVLRTGKLTWGYMDSILQSWDKKLLHSPEEIEAKDPARQEKRAAAAVNVSTSEKLDHMRKLVGHLNKPDHGEGA